MARRLISHYVRSLRERPVSTNVISGSIVMLLGDGIAQALEQNSGSKVHNLEGSVDEGDGKNPMHYPDKPLTFGVDFTSIIQNYDPIRGGTMVSWAAVGDVPINLALFSVIERTLRPMGIPAQGSLPQSMLKAVCFFVPGVIVRMPCFLAYITTAEHILQNALQGKPLSTDWNQCIETIQQKMDRDLMTIMKNGSSLWVPVNTFFFYVVPPELRPIGISFVAVGWMTYLSLMQHKA